MKFFDEFKAFINRGNVVDMAVGVIMGTAFTGIVNALVNNILMKFLSFITGKVDISKLVWTVSPDLVIEYGAFLQAILNFLLIAFSVFLIVKIMNRMKERMEHKDKASEEPEPAPEPELTKEELLLTEIRDLLKQQTIDKITEE